MLLLPSHVAHILYYWDLACWGCYWVHLKLQGGRPGWSRRVGWETVGWSWVVVGVGGLSGVPGHVVDLFYLLLISISAPTTVKLTWLRRIISIRKFFVISAIFVKSQSIVSLRGMNTSAWRVKSVVLALDTFAADRPRNCWIITKHVFGCLLCGHLFGAFLSRVWLKALLNTLHLILVCLNIDVDHFASWRLTLIQ